MYVLWECDAVVDDLMRLYSGERYLKEINDIALTTSY